MIRSFFALLVAVAALGAPATPLAHQSDLDAFMLRVMTRRDENWKKLQQYVLEEREHFELNGPGGHRLYGFNREYTWFIREGYFIRSPLEADGVRVSEADRATYERRWIAREKKREQRAAEKAKERGESTAEPAPSADETPGSVQDVLRQSAEPQFVSAAYFMRFKVDPGPYALAGRERIDDRDVLKIEYYPSKLFTNERTPEERARERDPKDQAREEEIERKMNKVSLVTLWVDPKEYQIIQYTFDNIDMDFLPGRSMVRLDELKASMKMSQPFPTVWLPASIEMQFGLTLAIGSVNAKYEVEYHDYRLAEVTSKIKPGPQ